MSAGSTFLFLMACYQILFDGCVAELSWKAILARKIVGVTEFHSSFRSVSTNDGSKSAQSIISSTT